jgi:predicted O-methyltransferase YrrM
VVRGLGLEDFISFERLLKLSEDLYRESVSYGIPAVSFTDGLIIMSLAFIASKSRNTLALDAGAGIGYSTLWIIAGVSERCLENCKVVALEIKNDRFEKLGKNLKWVLESLGVKNVEVDVVKGDAVKYLENLEEESVDYAFIDIEKDRYPEVLDALRKPLRTGGITAFHNAIHPKPPPRELFEKAENKPWKSTIIPTEAGILIAVKENL